MPEIATCPNCQLRVMPRDDNTCPSCRVSLTEAPLVRKQTLAKARREASGRIKHVNVAIGIFFLLWMLFWLPNAIATRLVVHELLHVPESDVVFQCKRIVAHALSAFFAYLIIRRLWPANEVPNS